MSHAVQGWSLLALAIGYLVQGAVSRISMPILSNKSAFRTVASCQAKGCSLPFSHSQLAGLTV
jgi:hypothetical protein